MTEDRASRTEKKCVRNRVTHLRKARLARASRARILSVEGCARYDDYRAVNPDDTATTKTPIAVLSTVSMQIFSCAAPTCYNSPLFADTVEYRMSLSPAARWYTLETRYL